MIKQGTVSVLFGCHSPIHSIIVIIAWYKLYKNLPSWWQIICIFLHDIGHWGKDYLDNYEEKKQHSLLGAKAAKLLFGQRGSNLVSGHNPYSNTPKSALHDPDKYSWVIAPIWWLILNSYLEPKLQRIGSTKQESAIMFKKAMRENMDKGFEKPGHEIYLEQWSNPRQPEE